MRESATVPTPADQDGEASDGDGSRPGKGFARLFLLTLGICLIADVVFVVSLLTGDLIPEPVRIGSAVVGIAWLPLCYVMGKRVMRLYSTKPE